jgi:3-oxoacyl-[acyl-carrier-protein] synthase II
MEPRAITGVGVLSSIAIGREEFLRAMHDPQPANGNAARPIETFDGNAYPNAEVAEVQGFDPTKYLGDKGLRTLDRLTKLLVVAARLAMHDAGLKKDNAYVTLPNFPNADRVGLCCSNAYGSLEAITELDRVAQLEDARYINPAKFPNTVSNSACGYVSIWEDLRALNVTISDGNCGALDAAMCADLHLETGRADAILAGGAEAMSEALFLAFQMLGAIEHGAHLGEAAALMVFEPLDLAKARGANILAEVVGYGTAFVAPETESKLIFASREAMGRAIASAIEDAGIDAKEIDVVASGLSGLRAFDSEELRAIEGVVDADAIIAAPKMLVGETLGAGAALAMIAAIGWLERGIANTIIRGSPTSDRAKNVKTVLVTSIGYYGNASALILRRPAG